jgi:hypothetical protein
MPGMVAKTRFLWCCALITIDTFARAVELGSEVGAAFRSVDQASSSLFAASVQDTRLQAPWHLDRIDQTELPLDGRFYSQVHDAQPSTLNFRVLMWNNLLDNLNAHTSS